MYFLLDSILFKDLVTSYFENYIGKIIFLSYEMIQISNFTSHSIKVINALINVLTHEGKQEFTFCQSFKLQKKKKNAAKIVALLQIIVSS